MILPLVFTNQRQLNGKTARNPKVRQAAYCYSEAGASGLWVVDKSLVDDSGSQTLRDTRIPAIVCLHQELNKAVPSTIRIAGPYWGLNLVLWARGLIDYPAIGVGSGFQYSLSGSLLSQSNVRLALPPLRRRAIASDELRSWLDHTVSRMGVGHPARNEFQQLYRRFSYYQDKAHAREQIARAYKGWFDSTAASPINGRSMAMFQDLSAAYALGRALTNIGGKGTDRKPESVVEPLMLNCL